MESKKLNKSIVCLFAMAVGGSGCDDGASVSEEGPPSIDAGVSSDGEEVPDAEVLGSDHLVPAVALSAESELKLRAQLDAQKLDPSNMTACGRSGLLASITGEEGRVYTFCGNGTVMQDVPHGVGVPYSFSSRNTLERIQEILPAGIEIQPSVKNYLSTSLSGGMADPMIVDSGYRVGFQERPSYSCQYFEDDCARVKAWADKFETGSQYEGGMSWCYDQDSPRTKSSQRTATTQLNASKLHYLFEGWAGVSACEGSKVNFRALIKCGKKKRRWKVMHEVNLSDFHQKYFFIDQDSELDDCEDTRDLRFKVKGGVFVMAGGYRTRIVP